MNHLVSNIESDIRRRGLRPGDRYLTTREVATQLHISTRRANDLMGILAQRGVLWRRTKVGTVIGPAADERPGLDVVHILIRQSYFFAERRHIEETVTGLTSQLPGTATQYSFVPDSTEVQFVERLIHASEAGELKAGYLIAAKSAELQHLFNQRRSIAVLLGTPFPGISTIPWIDKDQRAIGALIARTIIHMGHQRIALLLRDRRGFGDDLMVDAILQVLDTRLHQDALLIRSTPGEPSLMARVIAQLLTLPSRPTALICRSEVLLETARRVARDLKLRVPQDLQLAVCEPARIREPASCEDCIQPAVDTDAQTEGVWAGQMFAALAAGKLENRAHRLLAVSGIANQK